MTTYPQPCAFVLKNENILETPDLEVILERIKSLSRELIVGDLKHPYQIIFRGEPEIYHTALLPGVLRKMNHKEYEKNIFNTYITNHCSGELNILSVLAKMQHYGFPTRLLDWSKQHSVALFFACQSNPEKDGVLYLFSPRLSINDINPLELWTSVTLKPYFSQITLPHDAKSHGEYHLQNCQAAGIKKHLIVPCAVIINPEEFKDDDNTRLKSQDSLFTFHNGYVEKNKYYNYPPSLTAVMPVSNAREYVSRIIIPSSFKKAILRSLKDMMKIDTLSLFPDVPVYSEVEYAY